MLMPASMALRRGRTCTARLAARIMLRGAGAGTCLLTIGRSPANCASDSFSSLKEAAGDSFSSLKEAAASLNGTLSFSSLTGGTPSHPSGSSNPGLADQIVRLAWPVLSRLGFSGLLGVCVAQAAKSATKTAAIYVGIGVCALQLLVHFKYVTVHWEKAKKDLQGFTDSDGDGDFTRRDLSHWTQRGLDLMSYGLPQAGSFALGFCVGLVYI
jgi:uncharacterized membrane protein (Fun14 family)